MAEPNAQLPIRVIPRSSREGVDGERGGRTVIRVNAPPVDGKANAAVVRVVANALGVPRGAVTVLRGERSRDKVISVDGLSDAELRRRLDP